MIQGFFVFHLAPEEVKASSQKLVTADGTYATQSAFTSKTAGKSGSGEDKRYGHINDNNRAIIEFTIIVIESKKFPESSLGIWETIYSK